MSSNEVFRKLVETAIDHQASDLHLSAGLPPILRIFGTIRPIEGYETFMPAKIEEVVRSIMTESQFERVEREGEVDFSYGLKGTGRFRCNVSKQRGSLTLAMRVISSTVKPLEELGLPKILYDLAHLRDGLVLVTGPTGSGKSTTLASMIDIINRERRGVVITLEDPIEFLHQHKNCVVNQREVGIDTKSFANGLRSALRSDPDVILVGEMRDLETISIALTAAETGHLVLSTLHTKNAAKTIDRVIDVFPPESQHQIRVQLSTVLEAVISQQLFPMKFGQGMVPAVEVMIGTPAIRNMIRDEKVHQIPSMIETGSRFGMQSMKAALEELVRKDLVDRSAVFRKDDNL
ncbi:MAG TPA: type IV pili twitching motility protein PilT [Firmicutes bacterium]|nr:type IV pili twitching motility protein PilT [Bacillota bacterium]